MCPAWYIVRPQAGDDDFCSWTGSHPMSKLRFQPVRAADRVNSYQIRFQKIYQVVYIPVKFFRFGRAELRGPQPQFQESAQQRFPDEVRRMSSGAGGMAQQTRCEGSCPARV